MKERAAQMTSEAGGAVTVVLAILGFFFGIWKYADSRYKRGFEDGRNLEKKYLEEIARLEARVIAIDRKIEELETKKSQRESELEKKIEELEKEAEDARKARRLAEEKAETDHKASVNAEIELRKERQNRIEREQKYHELQEDHRNLQTVSDRMRERLSKLPPEVLEGIE
jgi:DNA repair exonuclease SbcCD ATPase subunit